MGTSGRQFMCVRLSSACVVAFMENAYRWLFCGVVLSDVRTPPGTMSLALSFDLGTALSIHVCWSSHQTHSPSTCTRDSGHLRLAVCRVQHFGFVLNFVEALVVICFLAVNVTAFRPGQGQRLIDLLATFNRLTRIARFTRVYEPRAP